VHLLDLCMDFGVAQVNVVMMTAGYKLRLNASDRESSREIWMAIENKDVTAPLCVLL
jgi:hypothetical protein